MNAYESAGRERKVTRLIESIDALCYSAGRNNLDPKSANETAGLLARAERVFWARLCLLCGVRNPSAETIQAVIGRYRDRAEDGDPFARFHQGGEV